jgi:hypothetical protein
MIGSSPSTSFDSPIMRRKCNESMSDITVSAKFW